MIGQKIKQVFPDIAVQKNTDNYSVFIGRNLPSFVKDFIIRKNLNDNNGKLNNQQIKEYLNKFFPDKKKPVKNRVMSGETVELITRFTISTDIKSGKTCFAISDAEVKASDAIIPKHLLTKYSKYLVDGEQWGKIKLVYNHPQDRKKDGHIEMIDYRPFKPYSSVDLNYYIECRKQFTTEEWIDVLISAMEYSPDGFTGTAQKLEFLTRLLPFVEPRLNMIELAPKGTGKSYIFTNLSKFGWLVSGGSVSRAKLFYNKSTQKPGIMNYYDVLTCDEIKTIVFPDETEMQAILKAYLESGKATVDNYEFRSECSMMLMGNIDLTSQNLPKHDRYFQHLPKSFRESALLDRFHGFIEGWRLPRIDTSMILKDWTLDVEYFSEILHLLRTAPEYSALVNNVLSWEEKADVRDLNAVKRITTAYAKLLFPHITQAEELDKEEFRQLCLEPAIRRRGIIREQVHKIDEEYKIEMPEIGIKENI